MKPSLLFCLALLFVLLSGCAPRQPLPAASLPEPAGWKLIFSDEFNGKTLDAAKWNTCYPWTEADGGCTNSGNNELEWYQPDEVSVAEGVLRLRAQKRSLKDGFPYTAGMVTSHQKFSFQYGYVESRLKVPAGQGLWPALWVLPEDKHWPPEIDILEVLGHNPKQVWTTLHYTTNGSNHLSQGSSYSGPDFSADYHTYGLLWEPNLVVWYIDGVERFYVESDGRNIPSEPFYLIANLAVGGNWPGSPDDSTQFPAFYDLDYIRVYRNDAYLASVAGPTPTPSGGQNIAHASAIQPHAKDGQPLDAFSPGILFWDVKVVNQDGRPLSGAMVSVELLDKDGAQVQEVFAWDKSDRFGKAAFSTLVKEPGVYTLRVAKITLYSSKAGYAPEKDAKPVQITVK